MPRAAAGWRNVRRVMIAPMIRVGAVYCCRLRENQGRTMWPQVPPRALRNRPSPTRSTAIRTAPSAARSFSALLLAEPSDVDARARAGRRPRYRPAAGAGRRRAATRCASMIDSVSAGEPMPAAATPWKRSIVERARTSWRIESARAAVTSGSRPPFFRSVRPFMSVRMLPNRVRGARQSRASSLSSLTKAGLLAAGVIGVVPDRLAQRQRAVHRHAVEEDVDVEQVLRPLPAHPAVDGRLPARDAHAPLGVARHHAALAEGHAGGIEHGGNLDPERLEPLVLGGYRARLSRRRWRCPDLPRAGIRRGRPSRARARHSRPAAVPCRPAPGAPRQAPRHAASGRRSRR